MSIVELTAAQTHDLRRRVLRVGTPSSEVTYVHDDVAGTVHLGVIRDGLLIAVSTWASQARPGEHREPPELAVRLRGMAVEPARQGHGVGALLVSAGIERAWASEAQVVWASARDTALAFYRRLGFAVVGDPFIDAATALPHHLIALHQHR